MEFHSPVMAKKMWNYLRVAFFLMRKGLISKRKLVMDLNLMMKRGKVLIGKSLGKNLMLFHHHLHSRSGSGDGGGFGLQEYEFSCSNSPNPVFSAASTKRRHHHYYFPCITAAAAADDTEESSVSASVGTPRPAVTVLPRIEYSPSRYSYDLAAGDEKLSPLPSPFSVRISDYSCEEEEEEEDDRGEEGSINGGRQVDDDAEEFIRRFYEQLRAQRRIALLQYQEVEYQEMLARGT